MWPRPTRPTAGSPTPTSYVQLTKTLAQHAREALDTLPKAAATEFCRPYDQLLRLVETQPATACSAPQGNGPAPRSTSARAARAPDSTSKASDPPPPPPGPGELGMSTDLARQLMEPVRSLSASVNALKPGRAEEIPPPAAHLRPAAPSSRVREPPPLPACHPSVSNLAFSGAKPHPWGDINMCSLTSDFTGTKATCDAVNRPPSSPHHFSNPRSGQQLDFLAAASDEKGKAALELHGYLSMCDLKQTYTRTGWRLRTIGRMSSITFGGSFTSPTRATCMTSTTPWDAHVSNILAVISCARYVVHLCPRWALD
eukprot:jgi/Tetstr1/440663/TSEL_028972.t1